LSNKQREVRRKNEEGKTTESRRENEGEGEKERRGYFFASETASLPSNPGMK
jgi:hypothetical protein